jgi:GntR family transcriptional regulator / MocR family aminotransferase
VQNFWTTSGADVFLPVEPGTGRRVALERAIRFAIRDGRLVAGTRMPSSRALARELEIARGTVVEAYALLAAEGYLIARQGSATRVADGANAFDLEPGVSPVVAAPAFDLRGGRPNLDAFPRSWWLAAARRAFRDVSSRAFDYGDPRGRPELRQALASYLTRARGVQVSPSQLVVCSGFIQGLGLLAQALLWRGAFNLALENPCVPYHRDVVANHGLCVKPLPVDGEGAQIACLRSLGVQTVVLTPAHQCPLGMTLHPKRRAEVIDWARESGGLIVEDDYDGEFRLDRQPVGALQGLDPQRVVYAGTASKTLAPGLRLGWLVVPADLLEPVVEAKRLADRSSGVLDQLTLAELIRSGAFDRHVRRMRVQYRRRRDYVIQAIAERVPALRPRGIAAGLHFVVQLPPGWPSERDIVQRAAERGISLIGLSDCWHAGYAGPPGIIVGYAAPADHAFAAATRALVNVLEACAPRA